MGGHHHSPEAMPKSEQDIQSLKDNQVPIALRDNCAHLLVGLNSCRRETGFNPDRCNHERHIYEECQYIAWLNRIELKKDMKEKAFMAARAAAAAAEAKN